MKLNYISTKLYLLALLFAAAAGLCYFRADAIYRAQLDAYLRRDFAVGGFFEPGGNEWHFAAFVGLCFAVGFAVTGYKARRSED